MWIAAAIKKPGSLHKELGVAEGKKIPKAKLEKAAKHKGVEGKRARLAETLEKMHHGKKKDHEKKEHHAKDPKPKSKAKAKMKKVMHEFKEGKLHSGSKKGPEVTNPKQAVAIAYSEAKKATKKSRK